MDILRAMQIYVRVVEAGSLVAAAQQLDTSSAAVSRQIASLEDHLGARLLNRTTRRLAMTVTGQDYYNRAVQILSDLGEAEAVAGQTTLRPSGLLRISAPLSFGITTLPPWLAEFRTLYPDLQLDIDLSDRLADLATDSIDVALRIARQPAATNVIARRLMPVSTVICAAPSYLARRGVPLSPHDLTAHDTLSYSYLSVGDSWTLAHRDGSEAVVKVKPCVHATNGDVLCQLAVEGLGIILQPSFIVERELAAGRLVPVLEGWSLEGFNLYAVYLSRKYLSAKVRVFIDHLAEKSSAPRSM